MSEVECKSISSPTTLYSPRPIAGRDFAPDDLLNQQWRTDQAESEYTPSADTEMLSITPSSQLTSPSLDSLQSPTLLRSSHHPDLDLNYNDEMPRAPSKEAKKTNHASNEKRRRQDATCLQAEMVQLLPPRFGHELRTALVGVIPEQSKTMKNLDSIAKNSESARNAVWELAVIYMTYLQMVQSKQGNELTYLNVALSKLNDELKYLKKKDSKQGDELRTLRALITCIEVESPSICAQFSACQERQNTFHQESHISQDSAQDYNVQTSHHSQQPIGSWTPSSTRALPTSYPSIIEPHNYTTIHHHTRQPAPDDGDVTYNNLIPQCIEITVSRQPTIEKIHKEQELIWTEREGKRTAEKKRNEAAAGQRRSLPAPASAIHGRGRADHKQVATQRAHTIRSVRRKWYRKE